MDVPKSDLGDVIAWSLRGGREEGREELIKATVMMKHFLFNESGENQEEIIFMLFFFRYCIKKKSLALY